MGALANHPHRRSEIAYCHCTQLPEKSGCRGLELKGYELGPGVHQTFGHMDDSVKASGSIHSVTDQFRSVRSGWPVGPIQEHHEFPAVPSIGHDASPRS